MLASSLRLTQFIESLDTLRNKSGTKDNDAHCAPGERRLTYISAHFHKTSFNRLVVDELDFGFVVAARFSNNAAKRMNKYERQ